MKRISIRIASLAGLLMTMIPGCGGEPSSAHRPYPPTFEQVYTEVFEPRGCTEGACHGKGVSWTELNDPDTAYDLLHGDASLPGCDLTKLVVPGDPDSSLLYVRLSAEADPDGACGNKMPVGTSGVTEQEAATVRAWIEAGALR